MSAAKNEGSVEAILGLGSNVGDKKRNIDTAIDALTKDGSIQLLARSAFYKSAPWGGVDQDWFVNVCVKVATTRSPRTLLEACQRVENDMGRVRRERWGPRNIDVDILTYGNVRVEDADLVIPHPRIGERAFVLVPLREIAPDMSIDGTSIAKALSRLDSSDVKPI
jgi:2-amino-4-hydroxy-6-hydroxymethyldihydropteridine diphosphokinase